MSQTNKPSFRATEIWKRFVGMFGGDAVERKFGKTPPPEWEAVVGMLRDFEIDRGMRRLVFSGKAGIPSLPEFTKFCRHIGTDDFDDGPKPPALPNPDGFTGDEWDMAANRHLLAYIARVIPADPQRYGRPASYLAMKADRKKSPNADASPEFIRAVGILIQFKNAWARDMREGNLDPESGEVTNPSKESQREAWKDCMQRAEAAIFQKAAA